MFMKIKGKQLCTVSCLSIVPTVVVLGITLQSCCKGQCT